MRFVQAREGGREGEDVPEGVAEVVGYPRWLCPALAEAGGGGGGGGGAGGLVLAQAAVYGPVGGGRNGRRAGEGGERRRGWRDVSELNDSQTITK